MGNVCGCNYGYEHPGEPHVWEKERDAKKKEQDAKMHGEMTRDEVQAIWGRAAALALGLNPIMNAAYERLAWACCVLDAFLARADGKVA